MIRVAAPLLLVSLVWAPLQPVGRTFLGYARMTWWAIGIGLLLGGLIDWCIPTTYISKFLARPTPWTIVGSVGLGVFFSGCSHGCLALSMALYKKGAAPAAVISFLLASPWASLSLTLVMLSLFGVKGLVLVACALIVALVTGLAFLRLQRLGLIEHNPNTVEIEAAFSIREDVKRRLRHYRFTRRRLLDDLRAVARAAWALADMVVWWLMIGFFLASLIGTFVPHTWFIHYLGPTIVGLLITMAVVTAIEVCSEGSAPLAFELFRHTGALGNTFAFLMGGVVTDMTELGLVWTNMGRRTALWMLVVTLPQVFLLGLLLNSWK